uniref:Uncharacterized protein n=1 Tax=Meloidogyne floridensis TaxID=298350 RepID=A0A915NNK9_9BILA
MWCVGHKSGGSGQLQTKLANWFTKTKKLVAAMRGRITKAAASPGGCQDLADKRQSCQQKAASPCTLRATFVWRCAGH